MNILMKTQTLLSTALTDGRASLSEAEGKSILADYGIKVPQSAVVTSADQAHDVVATMRGPFVVKVVSANILHKSDAGGVALHLADAAAVVKAIKDMAQKPLIAAAKVDGWLIEEMSPQGREIVVGGFRDAQFGPMIMVGLGGIFVEVLKDVSFRLCPITREDAKSMLGELRGYNLLAGTRGEAGVDIDALIDVILKVGGETGVLMQNAETIAELDLNPVLVFQNGAVAVDARFILEAAKPSGKQNIPGANLPPQDRLKPLFEPRTIAVLGASTKGTTIANTFMRRMKDFGYQGEIYPIHPKADQVEGLKAYTDLALTPEPVDYAYVAIGAGRIPDAVGAANGRCKIAQVISSGFAEVVEGIDLQSELLRKAHGAGVRLLGPNCLGTYSPRGGLTFPVGAPKELGNIGVISQSGGLSTDIIKRGQWRGIRFSGLVTMGNSCDLTPCDLLEYYFTDPQTKAVGMYLEDIKDGRAFFDLLRSEKATKPVVILKGGRSMQGRAAAASHTGALAGDDKVWDALAAQTGVVLVPHVNAFLDTLLALQCFDLRPEKPTQSITLFGNGGGSSVLGTDAFANVGLDVTAFDQNTFAKLDALGLPPGTSVVNPVDTPVATLQKKDGWVAGEILDIIYDNANPDAIAMHLNLAAFVGRGDVDPIDNLFTVIEQMQAKRPGIAHFGLALRSDGSPELEQKKYIYKERAREVSVPVYDEIPELAAALANISHLEKQMG